ncbi:MAG: rhodanese-like domain-containing protein [Candidatus Saccharimonas sp.]
MKKVVIWAGVIVAVFGGLIWLNQSKEDDTAPSMTFAAVTQDVKNGAKLYDVRTADEYKDGHFKGATNWSLQDMQAGKLPDTAKDTKIYVYCRSGNRSGQATTILKNAGYINITDLHGLPDVQAMDGKLITE